MDISDLPELLAAFSLGPVYGVAVAFLKNLLHILFKGTSSAYVGELCNFLMGAVFSLGAGFIYRRKKSRESALIGSIVGAIFPQVKEGDEVVKAGATVLKPLGTCSST